MQAMTFLNISEILENTNFANKLVVIEKIGISLNCVTLLSAGRHFSSPEWFENTQAQLQRLILHCLLSSMLI